MPWFLSEGQVTFDESTVKLVDFSRPPQIHTIYVIINFTVNKHKFKHLKMLISHTSQKGAHLEPNFMLLLWTESIS